MARRLVSVWKPAVAETTCKSVGVCVGHYSTPSYEKPGGGAYQQILVQDTGAGMLDFSSKVQYNRVGCIGTIELFVYVS
jgi:hypothetical protein